MAQRDGAVVYVTPAEAEYVNRREGHEALHALLGGRQQLPCEAVPHLHLVVDPVRAQRLLPAPLEA